MCVCRYIHMHHQPGARRGPVSGSSGSSTQRGSDSPAIYLYIYLSFFRSIYLSIYLPLCLSIYLSIYTYLSMYLCMYLYLCMYVSIYVSIYLSLSISIFIYGSIFTSQERGVAQFQDLPVAPPSAAATRPSQQPRSRPLSG